MANFAPGPTARDITTTHTVGGHSYTFYHYGCILVNSNNNIVAHVELARESTYDTYDYYVCGDDTILSELAPDTETNTREQIGQKLAQLYSNHITKRHEQ